MTAQNIEAKVKSIIADQLGVGEDEIKPESSFIEDLGADSLDIVELVMAMEEEFEIEIPDEEAENIKTVGDAIGYINRHKKLRHRERAPSSCHYWHRHDHRPGDRH